MITECYIKGRYDFGVGKCAVVITDDVGRGQKKEVKYQVAWKVPDSWEYKGETIEADQFSCEIVAATFAIKWCMDNRRSLVNLYFNTSTCEKWYYRGEFPESRQASARAYLDMVDEYYRQMDEYNGEAISDRINAEWIPKDCDDARYEEFNHLVNELAQNVK